MLRSHAIISSQGLHDIQYNNTQHNYNQQNATQHNDIPLNYTQHIETQHNNE